MGKRLFVLWVNPEKVEVMQVKLFIRNLSSSTTQDELFRLFASAGDVLHVHLSMDRNSGASRGFATITMSAQSEADKAVSMFNSYAFDDQVLKVALAKPRVQRGIGYGN
jgi:multiple RNA-binding domain-containing protein 1